MTAWVSRIDRTYCRHLATKDCGTCKGLGEIVVDKNTQLDVYDLGPCYCVERKLERLSSDAGIQKYREYVERVFAREPLKKAG